MFWFAVFVVIVIIVVIVIASRSSSTGSRTTAAQKPLPSVQSLDASAPKPYYLVLDDLQAIISSVTLKAFDSESIKVVITIEKKDDNNCAIVGSISSDVPFSYYNVAFGNGFGVNDDEIAHFKLDKVIGFPSVEVVKETMLRLFNWNNIVVFNNELNVLDSGLNTENPLIIYRFTAQKS